MNRRLEPITIDRIDNDAAKVVRRLTRHGHEAYLVGGCVRDMLLGRAPKDFDVATSATPDEIKQLFRNCRIIGRRFRLAHILFSGKVIETATFRAPPRQDAEDGDDDPLIWHDNEFGTAEEDARRRDFTINGLFYDVGSGKVIDWVDGMADLRDQRVRTIGDPDLRMQEDPVRILRAVKFSARLGFEIDEATREASVRHAALIARCSVARVLEEIYKLLREGYARPAFEQLYQLRVLGVLFPEIAALAPPELQRDLPALRAGRRRRSLGGEEGGVESDEDDSADAELALDDAHGAELEGQTEHAAGEDDEGEQNEALHLVSGPSPEEERRRAEALLADLELATAEDRERTVELLWGTLGALDGVSLAMDEPPQPPLLLAALLAPLATSVLREDRRIGQSAELVDALVRAVSLRLQVSRRHRERLKQIVVAQRRLAQSRPRHTIAQREYFPQAMQLLRLRNAATGDLEAAIERWDQLLTRGRKPSERPRGQRRGRRRGGRRARQRASGREGASGGEQGDA